MIIYDVEQGSLDWHLLRMGIPTASAFDRILTPGGKRSAQARGYLQHLIAESLVGGPLDQIKTSWMTRGHELEAEAVAYYEFERGVAAPAIGFVTDDAMRVGCSPDRLVGDDGLLEIKVPSPEVHVGYLLYEDVAAAYMAQLQGQLWLTGRQYVDICSYSPILPSCIIRVGRNEEYIRLLAEAIGEFADELDAEKARLSAAGYRLHDDRRIAAMQRCRRDASICATS